MQQKNKFPLKHRTRLINNEPIMNFQAALKKITQGIKITCSHKPSSYTFTKNNHYPKAKAHYIKYCKILQKVMKEAK
jgi:hypothetical protein